MKAKALHLALALPFVAFCAAELFFQSILCVASIAGLTAALAALNHRRLLVGHIHYASSLPCVAAEQVMRALGARHNLATPSRAFITDVFSTSYTASVDALVVTPRWLDDLKSDPDGAAAVVLHEIAHRQETGRLSRYLVTLTFGAWPVLFVIAAFYDIASLKANAPVSSSITYLAAAMAATTLAYGLGFLARSWASRALELRADAAAAGAGYASALIRRLGSPPATPGESGTLAPLHQLIYNLTSAHPGPAKRIRVLTFSVDQRDLALPLLGLRPHPASDVPDPLGTI